MTTLTTLVSGGRASEREAAIARAIATAIPTAIILEGLASGSSVLDSRAVIEQVDIHRIAPGCMCCMGNLTFRVTLNRILRHPPQRLLIGMATASHLSQMLTFLSSPPYDSFLTLTDSIDCDEPNLN